jgi:CMP/dCMP kinase
MKKRIITMDGPAGSGKSTVAKRVAHTLKLPYIDTGAMYRALTWAALKKNIGLHDVLALQRLAKRSRIEFKRSKNGKLRVCINGRDVTEAIRTPELTKKVHHIAGHPEIRDQMVMLQRKFADKRGGVLEGRDIGTVVFPHARHKFYLDALFKVRADRRYREMRLRGKCVQLNRVRRDIRERDHRDYSRPTSPLKIPGDAVIIDTTPLTIHQVIDTILTLVSFRQLTDLK